jgi:hypothetical protein
MNKLVILIAAFYAAWTVLAIGYSFGAAQRIAQAEKNALAQVMFDERW